MVLHHQILFTLAITTIAQAIPMRASAEHVLSLHRVLEIVHHLYLLVVHANICTNVVRAVGHHLALFCADFHSIRRCSVFEFIGEILKPTIPAAHKIDVIGKLQVAYGPLTNENGCVMAMECFLHDHFWEQVEQGG